jgi:hypothetical protein
MKKFLSFDYSKKIGILVKEKKNHFILDKFFEFPQLKETEFNEKLEKLIEKYKSILSINFENYINQEISIPLIKDRKTKEILIKNKLANNLEENQKYKFITIAERNLGKNIVYNIYAFPIDTLFKSIKIDKKTIEKLEKLFISQFSLFGVSNYLFPQEDVFHIYADNENLIITVSKGKNLRYIRTVDIPQNLDKNQILNIHYENINLTYQYVKQNKVKKIDLVLLSGSLSKDKELIETIYSFINEPICVVFKDRLIKNCDVETFDKFFIPIGNLFVPDNYNILPDDLIEKKVFNKFLVYSNFALFLGIILSAYYEFLEFNNIQNKLSVLDRKYFLVKTEIQEFKQNYPIKIDDLDFYMRYLNLTFSLEKYNVFSLIGDIENVISGTKIQNLEVNKKENLVLLKIKTKKQFNNLEDFLKFKEKVNKSIKALSKYWEINNKTKFNYKDLEIVINLEMQKTVGQIS